MNPIPAITTLRPGSISARIRRRVAERPEVEDPFELDPRDGEAAVPRPRGDQELVEGHGLATRRP